MSDAIGTTAMGEATGLVQDLCSLRGARACPPASGVWPAVRRVHSDTRSLQPGDLFVALRGERFDAHDFLAQARAAGAVLALAEHGLQHSGLPGVEVPDSRAALAELAQRWRARHALALIAVTGSNGKTTVTQMVASILRSAVGDAALATQGNLNNDIGVPLTVLRLRPWHRLAVVELGMNHPGEIAGLAGVAQPTVALVNNAQREHQEFMATVEAVARENAQVFAALPADGVAVFPHGDAYAPLWTQWAAGRRVRTFGVAGSGADVTVDAQWHAGSWSATLRAAEGTARANLRIAGRHNLLNAAAAAACALAAGVPLEAVARGLQAFEPVSGRSRSLALHWPSGARSTLIDDSYNANPDSVRAAIEVLAELPAPRLLVLGDMGEVGEQGLAFHQEVLDHALAQPIDQVLVTGDWMARACAARPQPDARLRHFERIDDLIGQALAIAPHGGSAVVKGSRFMRMERVVQALQAACSPAPAAAEGAPHAA